MNVSYKQLIEDSKELAEKLSEAKDKYKAVYGIPNGGILPAFIIAQELGLELISNLSKKEDTTAILIVDDLIDSGETIKNLIKEYGHSDVAVVYRKKSSPSVNFFNKEIEDEWIHLPHEQEGNDIEKNITRILQYLGEDVKREGLQNTPKRVIKSYKEIFSGYGKEVEDILTVFEGEDYDQMVVLKDIEFYSTCEHHMLPFFGKAHVAYIPNKKIVGLSKLARIVDIFSRRLQNQERLTMQIANALQEALEPQGVAVVIEGEHFCMKCRGVKKQNSKMKTAHLTGEFKEDTDTRKEFYKLIE